jgi:Arc/MetJ family transcription regulator
MRTNIELNDALVEEAMKYTSLKTKKDIVNEALKEFVANHKRLSMMDLKGKIEFADGYDHKALRAAR